MDPISPHIAGKVLDGAFAAILHVISVGKDRASSKHEYLDQVSSALAGMSDLREKLGDHLGPIDQAIYRNFECEYVYLCPLPESSRCSCFYRATKDVVRLKKKIFGGKAAAESLALRAQNHRERLTVRHFACLYRGVESDPCF